MKHLLATARLVTNDGPPIENAALAIDDHGKIAWIGARDQAPGAPTHEAPLVTPGLVDAHTHLAWAGSRHLEYAMRMSGADYVAIAKAGGGIASTHRAVADASEDELARLIASRLERMASLGVTTVEVKSGYGLTRELEMKQLRAIARASSRGDLPRVVPTVLALHSLPPGETDRAKYTDSACALVGEASRLGLARFVDAYVDEHAFDVAAARKVATVAKDAGLGVRLHVGQFSDVGGAELAAELGAKSADHLEHLSERGARALADAGVCAGLLPTAAFTLGQAPPDVALLRRAAVSLVVASDANPGTAPTESLPLAMALAVRTYGLSPDEALAGATVNAARSLDLDTGVLRIGARADLVLWDLPHEIALVQPWGTPRARLVMRDGTVIAKRD
ncbi:MAG TPA: imidazolonepropionase [Polyangiaceae bacterium]|jgi:imidazolonepropionase